MELFEQMMAAAQAAQNAAPDAAQILAVQTEGGRISAFPNDLSAAREEAFLAAPAEPLAALLCIWKNGQLDVPSFRVRKGLLQAEPGNADAVLFLQGETGVCARTLSRSF